LNISFYVPKPIESIKVGNKYRVTIQVDGHERFVTEVLASANIRIIHLQSDKQFYRAGETGIYK
jgi:MarR-like DNA-binding transcriptional regulator SgrR of sgrS sRNA